MTSTRLPGKVLLPIGGQPMLSYHIHRLQRTGFPIYVATTHNRTDDPLAEFAAQRELACVRGDEHNVLSRYVLGARLYNLDVIVRVTSDCPLLDGDLIAEGIADYLQANDSRLYLSNALKRTFPRGFDFEIFSRELLEEAATHATLASDLEHVTPYIHQNRSGQVNFRHFTREEDRSAYRLTVDTPEDFELIRQLIELHHAERLPANDLIAILDAHPELVALNAHIEQKKL